MLSIQATHLQARPIPSRQVSLATSRAASGRRRTFVLGQGVAFRVWGKYLCTQNQATRLFCSHSFDYERFSTLFGTEAAPKRVFLEDDIGAALRRFRLSKRDEIWIVSNNMREIESLCRTVYEFLPEPKVVSRNRVTVFSQTEGRNARDLKKLAREFGYEFRSHETTIGSIASEIHIGRARREALDRFLWHASSLSFKAVGTNLGIFDPDFVAAHLATEALLRGKIRRLDMALTHPIQRPENLRLAEYLDLGRDRRVRVLGANEVISLERGGFWMTLDGNPFMSALSGHIPPDTLPWAIVDHHLLPAGSQFDPEKTYIDIRTRYGATATIFTEMLQTAGTRLTTQLATALYYGIETDIGGGTFRETPADRGALDWLRTHVDFDSLRAISGATLPDTAASLLAHAFQTFERLQPQGPLGFSFLGDITGYEDAALPVVAEDLVRIFGLYYSAAAGIYRADEKWHFDISARANQRGLNWKGFLEKHLKGGGHADKARAKVAFAEIPELAPHAEDALPPTIVAQKFLSQLMRQIRIRKRGVSQDS